MIEENYRPDDPLGILEPMPTPPRPPSLHNESDKWVESITSKIVIGAVTPRKLTRSLSYVNIKSPLSLSLDMPKALKRYDSSNDGSTFTEYPEFDSFTDIV